MGSFRNIAATALMIIAFLLANNSALAEIPAPEDFEVELDENNGVTFINITWEKNNQGDSPEYYNIYQADERTDNVDDFELLEQIEITNQQQKKYTYKIDNPEPGEYSFFIKASLIDDGQEVFGEATDIKYAVVPDDSTEAYVEITSEPEEDAEAGKQFIYNANAESNINCPINWELVSGPDGMEINENSGVLSWTPEQAGEYDIEIKAFLSCSTDVEDTQSFTIEVIDQINEAEVEITSEPDTEIMLGDDFEYQLTAETNVDCGILFELKNSPESMTISEAGLIEWTPEETGNYQVVVRAYLDCDHTVSDMQAFTIQAYDPNDDAELEIVSVPPTSAYINKQYIYKIKSKTSVKCDVIYTLKDAPEGMTLEDNGLIKWMPGTAGEYDISIGAYLDCAEEVTDSQEYILKVYDGAITESCATISGEVEDSDGNFIEYGTVMAWNLGGDKSGNVVYRADIENGQYSMEVSDGTYVIKFNADEFIPEWYDDTNGMKDAARIEIECDDALTISAILDAAEETVNYNVSGMVVSSEDNTPVMAKVHFIPVGNNKHENDNSKGNTFFTETLQDGSYSISLPDNYTYIAQAVPMQNSEFRLQFYNAVYDATEAEEIELDSDLSRIDFYLEGALNYDNGFSGSVMNEDGDALQAVMMVRLAEPADENEDNYKHSYSVETNEDGEYSFTNVLPGKYVLLSRPVDNDYIPGFYNSDGTVVKKWKESDQIEVIDAMVAMQFDCIHSLKRDQEGLGKINGKALKGESGKINFGDRPLGTDPLQGALMMLKDDNDIVVAYSFSDVAGDYLLENIEPGEYTLAAEKIGFEYIPESLTVDFSENIEINSDMVLEEETSTGVDETLAGLKISPIPASEHLNISFSSLNGITNIRLFNMFGKEVYTSGEILNRTYRIELNMLPQGWYTVQIQTNGNVYSRSIIIIK